MTNLLESIEVMLMTFFEQERMKGKLTQMLYLNNSRQLQANKAPSIFVGMHITETGDMYHIDQDFYMNKIEQNPSDVEFNKFAS